MNVKFAEYTSDKGREKKQLQETQEPVLDQREEAVTESLDEEANIEIVQKSAEVLFATPQSLATAEMTYTTQEETVPLNEILTASVDDSDFLLDAKESGAVSEVQIEKTKVHRDVEFTEHATADDTDEKATETQQEISLQEEQTIEIVEKTSEECTEVTVTLPQLAALEADKLGSHREQEMYTGGLPNVEDVLTLQISRECFSEDESITINTVAQQLTYSDSLPHLAEQMEFVILMVAGTETASDTDKTNVDKGEKLDESVGSNADADKNALVAPAEKETCLKPERQTIEDLDTPAQPEVQSGIVISTVEPDDETSESVDDGVLEEIKPCQRQREAEEEEAKQLLEEPAPEEENLNEVEDASLIVIEAAEDSQPFVIVESAASLLCELDDTESLVVEAEKKASMSVHPETTVAIDEMLIQEKEVKKSSQSEMEEDATVRKAIVVTEAVEKVPTIRTEEKVEKSDETVEEAKAKKAEHLQTDRVSTDYLTETGTSAADIQEEAIHVMQCTECIYGDETTSEFEIMLPTNKNVVTHPITDSKVEGYEKCVEVTRTDAEECDVKAAEEISHISLYVGNQGISSSPVEVMLPVNEDEVLSVVSDVKIIIGVEEDEMQKKLHGKIIPKVAYTVNEDTSEVQETDGECQNEVKTEAKRTENAESITSPATETATALGHLDDEKYESPGKEQIALLEKAEKVAVLPRLDKEMLLSQKVAIERAADETKDETEITATSRKLEYLESVIAEASTGIKTTTSPVQQQIVNVPTSTEEHDDGTSGQDRHETESNTEFKVQQLVMQAFEMATAKVTPASEIVPISTEEMQVEMSVLHLEVEGIDIVAESDIAECIETVEDEVRTVSTDIQEAVLMTPKTTERDANILHILTDIETDNEGQDDKVIDTLAPAECEKEFPVKDSKQYVPDVEEIESSMKKDREHTELTTACGSEEATLGQLLTGTSDDEICKERETVKPVTEEAVTRAVQLVFSSSAEHEVDLVVIHHVSDVHELARITTNETAAAVSHSEDEITVQLLEVDVAHQEEKKSCLVPVIATAQPSEAISEAELTLLASGNEAAATVLCATDRAGDSIVTMQYSREYVPNETEVSQIVFPTLPVDDTVPDTASADDTAVRVDTNREMLDDYTLQFPKALETSSHLKTDFTVEENTPVMADAKCTVLEDVQPELFVPYNSSVIVHSGDAYAQTNVAVKHLSESVVDKPVIGSVRITEIQSSEQDEHTLSLNEEFLCDNATVVFPENVESSLLGDQPSSGITESEITDLPEQSLLFGGILLPVAEKDELQKDDSVKQLQNATVESTMIEMRLSDKNDTLIVRPEKPEFSETISLEEKRTERAPSDDEIFQESIDKGDVMIGSPVLVTCGDDARLLKTDVQDSEILPDAHLVYEKNVDVLLHRVEIDESLEFDKTDEAKEDAVQLSKFQVSLFDGTPVHVVREVDVCDAFVPVVENVYDKIDTSRTEEVEKMVDDADGPENLLSVSHDIYDAAQTSGSDSKILESMSVGHRTSSLEFLEDVQTQQFETSVITEPFTEVSDSTYTETPNMENERGIEKHATSSETDTLIAVDLEEPETVNIKPVSCELTTDAGQHRELEYAQKESEVKSSVDLPWNLLFADLLGDDSTTPVTLSGDVSKEDDGRQGMEASDVEREKPVERQAVSDDKAVESSGASKSSVVTRKVQRVSADGRVVERVKSEEVPMSFGPASLTPYFFGGDMPSPPDFSPQSDEHLSSTNSVKVYTDTVEGEPWTERRVEEVEETRPDGATVTRRVVRVRKRRTIIKHIVIEGPEFEEMVLDEPDKVHSTTVASNAEGDFHTCVDEQLEQLASKYKQTSMQSDTDSAAKQMSVEAGIAARNEDFSHIGLTETDRLQSTQLCSYNKVKTHERVVDSDDDVDKDTMSSLPSQHTSLGMQVSLELSHARVLSQADLLGEARQYGDSESFALDVERDTGSSVGDGCGLDNVESASSCGDFATGISRHGHA